VISVVQALGFKGSLSDNADIRCLRQ